MGGPRARYSCNKGSEPQPNKSKKNVFKIVLSQKEAGAAIPLIILMVIVSFVNKNFFGLNNLMDVLRTASFWIMIAVPVTFLLCAGGIDVSGCCNQHRRRCLRQGA